MADQLSFDAIGALTTCPAITPNLDRLVDAGVSFSSAYCNSPVCGPSRASLLTGRLPRKTRVYDNAAEFSSSLPTIAHFLRLAGYRTVLSGKMHFVGPDQLHGFEHRLTTDVFPSSFVWTEKPSRRVKMNGGANVDQVRKSGIQRWSKYYEYDEEVTYQALKSLRTLGEERDRPPFFMCVSFTHPHQPFEALPEYAAMYEGLDVPLPMIRDKSEADLTQYEKWIRTHLGLPDKHLSEDVIRRARRAYYAMVSYIDRQVGLILDELENQGFREQTLVVFTSDHGEMLGEHDLWYKRTYHEHSVRVPLVMGMPGLSPERTRVDQVVSLIDLPPTILELCGAQDPDGVASRMDGQSFASLLSDPNERWKNEAVFEYYDSGTLRPMLGIRKDNYKYVYVHGVEQILFDLAQAPYETLNLAGDPSYSTLMASLHARVTQNWEGHRIEADISESRNDRRLVHQAMLLGERVHWDYQPATDVSKQYVR